MSSGYNEVMHYYEVFVTDPAYQKPLPLTYASPHELVPGQVVLAPFGRSKTAGFIVREVARPDFATKEISTIVSNTPLPKEVIQLHDWLKEYYPSGSGARTQLFIPSGLDTKHRPPKNVKSGRKDKDLPALTKQQKDIISSIKKSGDRTFLLHGETGSGKTRTYIELAQETMANGRSVLILTPEITLISQLADSFSQAFSDINILHSKLPKAQRNRTWLNLLETEKPTLSIGTRSALFSPLKNLGLIVVDEMHEPSYKQEQSPRYHALRVAAQLARLHNSTIIYGSATPPVTEHYLAEITKRPILRMTESALRTSAVSRSIIDLKNSSLFSRHRFISNQLLDSITARLTRKEQVLLFLNRRGTARLVLCQACGWQALCPRCDVPLVYHGDRHAMQCHTCGYRSSPPFQCPTCASDAIIYRSLGTKALAESLTTLFPQAVVKRFDTDNLANEQLSRHFADVVAGKVDILVGTQMLGKGLDLPKLSLVGIINADTSLGVPDFSSAERSYQLLHQAIGRVGRGHLAGEVIIQSYNPESSLLKAAAIQDWRSFYEQELKERQLFNFPPFAFLLKIAVSRKSPEAAERAIRKLRQIVAELKLPLTIEMPSPAFYERSHGLHNWQLVIRAKDRKHLVTALAALPPGDYTYDLDPINLL